VWLGFVCCGEGVSHRHGWCGEGRSQGEAEMVGWGSVSLLLAAKCARQRNQEYRDAMGVVKGVLSVWWRGEWQCCLSSNPSKRASKLDLLPELSFSSWHPLHSFLSLWLPFWRNYASTRRFDKCQRKKYPLTGVKLMGIFDRPVMLA